MKYARFNVSAIVPPGCLLRYPGDEGWKCLFGEYRMEFLTVPFFLVASQYDSYQLELNLDGVKPPYTMKDEIEFADNFANKTRSVLRSINSKANSTAKGIYSWSCYNHAVSNKLSFAIGTTLDGVTLREAFSEFLSTSYGLADTCINESSSSNLDEHKFTSSEIIIHNSRTLPLLWLHECSGVDCGKGCK
jgi:hypothetical protein